MDHRPGRAAARQRRADAERSIEAILDATLACAPAGGTFNMAAIARTAGVSRVTLYTHFPTREALVRAALDRGVALADEVLSRSSLDEGPAPAALTRLLRSSWQILDRHRNVFAVATTTLPPAQLRAYHEPVLGRVERLVVRGQADGDFRTDLPRDWLVATIYGLMHLAAEQLGAGRIAADRAGEMVATTILSLLATERRPVTGGR
jgi:TetR/AcrR family transcriptional repressor of mexCD-oprJ operon